MNYLPTKLVCIILTTLFLQTSINACTRVLYAKSGETVLVGNNMDWFDDLGTNLVVYPRGILRSGRTPVNPLHWSSKYGSIVASARKETITTNGMNEKGLGAHLLALMSSSYGERREEVPGIAITEWAQFYLDNFATVQEAVEYTKNKPYQLVTWRDPITHLEIRLHLALEDATGDSAIIEVVDGEIKIYHDKSYKILTNDPVYPEQLKNTKRYVCLGGDKPLPGSSKPTDRFVRASFYLNKLEGVKSEDEKFFGLLSIMQNAGAPYRFQDEISPPVAKTVWRIISDLTHRVFYFNSSMRYNIIWARLDQLDLNEGAPIMQLDLVNRKDLVGDVSREFHAV